MKLENELNQKRFKNEYQKLAVNLVFTGSWLNLKISKHLKPFGITPQQFNILRILRGQHPNPATINLLTGRMLDKMSNASRLVEKLRLKGLVARKICKSDRRAVDVVISKRGLNLLDKIEKLDNEWREQFLILSEAEAKELNNLLDKLRG